MAHAGVAGNLTSIVEGKGRLAPQGLRRPTPGGVAALLGNGPVRFVESTGNGVIGHPLGTIARSEALLAGSVCCRITDR